MGEWRERMWLKLYNLYKYRYTSSTNIIYSHCTPVVRRHTLHLLPSAGGTATKLLNMDRESFIATRGHALYS